MMRTPVLLAILIAVAAVLWIGSGMIDRDPPLQHPSLATQDKAEDDAKEIFQVRVRDLEVEEYVQNFSLNGRSRANRAVELKTEIDGQVVTLFAREGATVTAGQDIMQIAPQDRAERVREAQSLVAQREIEYNASKSLESKGFNSRIKLAEAASQLDAAKAALKRAREDLGKTKITAPFDGILAHRLVDEGDYVKTGDTLISLVDLDPIEVVGFVSEHKIRQIDKGAKADITVRAAGVQGAMSQGKTDGALVRSGDVTYIAPIADPLTRTFEIQIRLDNADAAIIDGLTVGITIPLAPRKAYRVSPSVLTLGPQGTVGVKIVDADDIVRFVPVDILTDTADAMWVGGLPDKIRLITLGQDFVAAGVKVKPVPAEDDGLL